MRVSSNMIANSRSLMEASSNYKSFMKSKGKSVKEGDAKDKDNKNVSAKLGSNLIVTKKKDKMVVTHASGDKKGKIVKEYDLKSKLGAELNQFLQNKNLKDNKVLNSKLSQANAAIRSAKNMSLVDYL